MNMDKSIQHWTFTGFKYSKTPYIRAEVLRTISLKFDNSFRIKLCIGSLNEPTPWLTMADLDKMLTGFRVWKLHKNAIFVHFHWNLGILTEFQKPCDPIWIRYWLKQLCFILRSCPPLNADAPGKFVASDSALEWWLCSSPPNLEFFKRENKMKMSQQAGSNPWPQDH